jgi:hypothetical protein
MLSYYLLPKVRLYDYQQYEVVQIYGKYLKPQLQVTVIGHLLFRNLTKKHNGNTDQSDKLMRA